MVTIFSGGKIVTAECTFKSNVVVEDEKIIALTNNLDSAISKFDDAKVIDISDKMLLPGAIDAHVHLDLDVGIAVTADDYLSGTKSAACGGVTTVIDYPTQYKDEPIVDAVHKRQLMAKDVACVDYGFHCAITDINDGKIFKQFSEAIDAGITSVKCYMVYKDRGLMLDDAELMSLLIAAKKNGIMVNVHCENEDILVANQKYYINNNKKAPWYHYKSRPEYVSAEAVNRAVRIACAANAPIYIVHTDCADAVSSIGKAQCKGYKVYSETCPQYLALTKKVYKREDAYKYVCSPPIKGKKSKSALWNALNCGIVQTIATDHCSFKLEDKLTGLNDFTKIPNGCPGIETSYPYMLSCANDGKLTFNKVVELMCSNPARIFGCINKGCIAPGYDADLVVYDPSKCVKIEAQNLHSNCDYTIFENFSLRGYPVQTYLRGELVYDKEKFVGKPGDGKYIKRDVGELI